MKTTNENSRETKKKHPLITAQIISMKQVIDLTTLSRSTIYRMILKNDFPQPIALSRTRNGFYLHEIENWLVNRPRTSEFMTRCSD